MIQDTDSLALSNTVGSNLAPSNTRLNDFQIAEEVAVATLTLPSSLQLSREETIKQVTATFPAKNYSKDFRLSDVSFVCTDKENDGRKSNAVFNIQPSK